MSKMGDEYQRRTEELWDAMEAAVNECAYCRGMHSQHTATGCNCKEDLGKYGCDCAGFQYPEHELKATP